MNRAKIAQVEAKLESIILQQKYTAKTQLSDAQHDILYLEVARDTERFRLPLYAPVEQGSSTSV